MSTIPPPQSSLSLLDPRFQPIAEKWLAAVKLTGLRVRIVETLRSKERQAALRGKGGLTWVDVSEHEKGRAFDFALFTQNGVYQTNNLSGDYTIAGEIGEAMGLEWGGRWKKMDFVHLQWKPPQEALVA